MININTMLRPSLILVAITLTIAEHGAASIRAADNTNGIRVIKDVAYLGEGRKEKLDLYLPLALKDGPKRPAVLIVHGGGWHGGDKAAKREQNIGTTLANAGYVCASVNYVLAERKELFTDNLRQVWPRNLQDCMTAVRFLRSRAKEYHINPERIGAVGGSAGGHLVAMLAYVDASDGLDPTGPYAGHSCRVQAVIPMYGAHDLIAHARARELLDRLTNEDKELARIGSPVTYIDKEDPPALILHGTKDALVPVEQSELLYKALKQDGVEATLHIIEGAPHSFHFQPKQEDLRPMAIDFLDRHLRLTK